MRVIEKQEALELLGRAVQEKGDGYVYHTPRGVKAGQGAECTYFHGERPGCIVGHVLSYIGLLREDLITGEDDFNGETGFDEPRFIRHLRSCNVAFTETALDVLCAAQAVQDGGGTWGGALHVAKEDAN